MECLIATSWGILEDGKYIFGSAFNTFMLSGAVHRLAGLKTACELCTS